jgi:hypothetical protein
VNVVNKLAVSSDNAESTASWGTIPVGEGRLQVRHLLLWIGIAGWLLPIFFVTSVHGIAWFAFNVSAVAILTLAASLVRTVPLHKIAICFLGGAFITALVLAIEQGLGTALGATFPLRHLITVPLEELAKIAIVIFVLWRGRNFSTWTLGATDIFLLGTAAGAGFGYVENAFAHFLQPAPLSNFSVFLPATEIISGRVVCGHAVWSGLCAGVLGLAWLFSHKRSIVLPIAAVGFFAACFDHAALNYSTYGGAWPQLRDIFNALALNGYVALGLYLAVLALVMGADMFVLLSSLPKSKEFKLPRRKDRKEHLTALWDCVIDLRRLNFAYFRYQHWHDDRLPSSLALTVALLTKRLVNRYLAVDPTTVAAAKTGVTTATAGDAPTLSVRTANTASADNNSQGGGGISPFDKRPLKDLIDLPERYELIEEAFRGGMGMVFRARHRQTRADLAVKILHPHLAANHSYLRRFEQEAKAASQLKHPNIVTVHDFGVTPNDVAFLVMEWLEGPSLEKVVKMTGPLSGSRFTSIFIQAANALAHAHRNGVVHRDIKPSNILLTKSDTSADNVKIVDFGIAKILTDDHGHYMNLTSTGDLLGSPFFMSPEQCSGGKIDNRSDIYSLGCVMYESLCGVPPFTGSNPAQMYHKHLNEMPKQPRTINANIANPELYEPLLFKCLQKDPDKRFASMEELEQELTVARDALRSA